MTELKPCPFCGGNAEIVYIEDGENAGGSCVCCHSCMASSNVEFEFKENFVSNWNRRVALIPPPAVDEDDYDAGLLNDYGGGDVEWWQDYLRAEIGRANDHWRSRIEAAGGYAAAELTRLRAEKAALVAALEDALHRPDGEFSPRGALEQLSRSASDGGDLNDLCHDAYEVIMGLIEAAEAAALLAARETSGPGAREGEA